MSFVENPTWKYIRERLLLVSRKRTIRTIREMGLFRAGSYNPTYGDLVSFHDTHNQLPCARPDYGSNPTFSTPLVEEWLLHNGADLDEFARLYRPIARSRRRGLTRNARSEQSQSPALSRGGRMGIVRKIMDNTPFNEEEKIFLIQLVLPR